jgi:tetratricopeptide (TPR) repeat protein
MKKAVFVLLLVLLLVDLAAAQDVSVIPMYGGIETPEMRQAHDEYIESMLEAYKTKEASAEVAVKLGWREMAKRDWRTAIRRFNQAWLLNPLYGEIYWGFGAAQAYAGNYEDAEKHFEKAYSLLSGHGRFLSDYALYYLYRANHRAKPKPGFFLDYIFGDKYDSKWKADVEQFLNRSLVLSEEASQVAPNEARIYQVWAQAQYGKGDYATAWEKAIKAEQLGDKLNPKFEKALGKKMKRPEK